MPRGKHIQVIIGVDGRCRIDVVNFAGPACPAAMAEIPAAVGGQFDHQHEKPEARTVQRCGQRARPLRVVVRPCLGRRIPS